MSNAPTTIEPRRLALLLAADADCDVRTAARAVREGPRAVRGRVGERLAVAMRERGLAEPSHEGQEP